MCRTRKLEDFQKQPWAEICWYFTETREQYRLTGKLSLIDKNAEDKAQRVSRIISFLQWEKETQISKEVKQCMSVVIVQQSRWGNPVSARTQDRQDVTE